MFRKMLSKADDRISPVDAMQLLQNRKDAVLLDVRTPEENLSVRIPGSVNVPLDRINKIDKVVSNKDTPVIVYCLSGARASAAIRILKSKGYTDVSNLGGINAWPYKTIRGKA